VYNSQTPFRSQIPNLSLVRTISDGYNFTTIEGSLTLPCWQDFVIPDREGIKRVEGSQVYLDIMGEVAGKPVVTKEQVVAYEYLLEHQVAIQQSLLNTLLLDYAEWRDDYSVEDEAAMPEVDNTAQFKPLIQLSRIHLLQTHHEGIAYTGYEFKCTWEEEHRLGFLAHKDRMAASGHADVSFTEWMAEGDLRDRSVVRMPSPVPVEKKPWWRFW
jgi:hypothetical protein